MTYAVITYRTDLLASSGFKMHTNVERVERWECDDDPAVNGIRLVFGDDRDDYASDARDVYEVYPDTAAVPEEYRQYRDG